MTYIHDGESGAAAASEAVSELPTSRVGAHAPVGTIAASEVIAVDGETSGVEIIRILVERGISGAPVLSRNRRALGVVSLLDLARELYDELESPTPANQPSSLDEQTASELMSQPAITL